MSLVIWKGPTNALVFANNSPTLTYGDRVKAVDIYHGPQWLCAASMLARGTYGTGFRTGWVVNQCTCANDKGTIGTLTIEWEAGGASANQPLPVGDFSLEPQELYPKIERAGVFAGITGQTVGITYNALYGMQQSGSGQPVGEQMLKTQIAATQPGYNPSAGDYNGSPASTQLPLAQNLLAKLLRGEETFYLVGQRYSYWFYSYTQPALSSGGVIVTPDGPLGSTLPANLAWLRLADRIEPAGVNGSMFKITRSYIGGPTLGGVGFWDSDIYT